MSEAGLGISAPRVGGSDRVTGAQRFAADIAIEDVLHVALVHLDCGHAAIEEIDTSAAAGIEGVVRVFTAEDSPPPRPTVRATLRRSACHCDR